MSKEKEEHIHKFYIRIDVGFDVLAKNKTDAKNEAVKLIDNIPSNWLSIKIEEVDL